MRRKAAAIVQHQGSWYGITFSPKGKEIDDLSVYSGRSLSELKRIVEGGNYAFTLDNGAAFLFKLAFPFSDKRKIKLVIGSELEERMPVSIEDMEVNFLHIGQGKVLASALPKSLADELRQDRNMRISTIHSLAVLYALRWFRLVQEDNFVFVHMSGNATVVMAYKDGNVHLIRQFFHSPGPDSLADVFRDITSDVEIRPRSYIMVCDDGDAEQEKAILEQKFGITIDTPKLRQVLGGSEVPEWYWPGIGAGLLALDGKNQLNLTGKRTTQLLLTSKTGVYASAALACLGVLACGLSYFDYTMKERAYTYLASEPARIYKTVFPKAPPIRDPITAFRQKVKALEKQPGTSQSAVKPLALLDEISRRIPADVDVKVSEFSSDDKEFIISGTTVSFAVIEKIKTALEQMKGVSLVEAQNLDLMANKQVKFKLRGKL